MNMNFLLNRSVMVKLRIIVFFAIFYFIIINIINANSLTLIKDTFYLINNNEIKINKTVKSVIDKVNKLNNYVIVKSVTKEVTNDSVEHSKNLHSEILKELKVLNKTISLQKNKELSEILKKVEIRYNGFSTIALTLHNEFTEDFEDGIDGIFGLDAISIKMNKELDILKAKVINNYNNKVDDMFSTIDYIFNFSLLFTFISIILFSYFSHLISRSITKSINTFKDGLIDFFKYLKQETTVLTPIDESKNDEVCDMAKVINENIKTVDTMEEDREKAKQESIFIQQVSTNLKELSNGNLKDRIVSDYNGEFVGIKNSINELASKVENIILDINHMSKEHDLGDIDVVIPSNNYQGDFNTMASGINDMVNGHISMNKQSIGVIAEFGKGNFDAPLDKLPGKKVFINETVENVRANLKALISNFEEAAIEIKAGNLKTRASAEGLDGGYVEIISHVNDIVSGVDT
ncbi:MAG: hypothetical protein U9Q30_05640, partial [Campylobacterota bacterium]|nr:hypothetical protein [Campylobacterota bacterium]